MRLLAAALVLFEWSVRLWANLKGRAWVLMACGQIRRLRCPEPVLRSWEIKGVSWAGDKWKCFAKTGFLSHFCSKISRAQISCAACFPWGLMLKMSFLRAQDAAGSPGHCRTMQWLSRESAGGRSSFISVQVRKSHVIKRV